MKMSKQEYGQLAKDNAPKSRLLRDTALAWLVGGLICVGGQGLMDWYKKLGLSKEISSTAVAMTLVTISAVLTALHLYSKIAKWGGAGTLVPITGFANAMVSPAMEFKSEGHVAGVITSKGLSNQSPENMAAPMFEAQADGYPRRKGGRISAYLTIEY
jgi:stage V sporulation protein AC